MNIIDRIILILYSFCLALLSIAIIMFPFQQLNFLFKDNVNLALKAIEGNYVYSAVGLIFLLINIRFIVVSFKGNKNKKKITYIVQRTEYGEINISSDTIVGLVQNVSEKFTGVRNIKIKVDILEGQIYIDLRGEVTPEINIPKTTEELQSKVKEHVENCTGVNVNEIRVIISNVTASIRSVK